LRAFQPAIEIALKRQLKMTTISSVALTHQMKNTLTPDSNMLIAVDRKSLSYQKLKIFFMWYILNELLVKP